MWKNQNFSLNAIAVQEVLNMLKDGKIELKELQQFIDAVKTEEK